MKVYIGNLPYATTEDDLKKFFGKYKSLASCTIALDHDTGRSKGYGFAEFSDDDDAKAAVNELNGAALAGKALRINLAAQ